MANKQQKRRGGAPTSDQWMDFAEKGFDADEYAEGFFLTHNEAEADERCTELTNLRYHTQDLLRQKVSSHYQLFMRGTEDIQHVEQDIAQLRKLVSRMQESLKNLDAASSAILGLNQRADGGRGGLHGARPSSVSFDHLPLGGRPASRSVLISNQSSSSVVLQDQPRLPKWVNAAPEELQRLVVEKQRSQAVALIEKVREFFAQSKNNWGGAECEILTLINKKADEVAERIIQDLEDMARTILYDFRDMSKQLKMLIILGKPSTAVSFFIRNRGGIIERSLRLLEGGGDPLTYVTLLSDKFFDLLTGACATFDALFNLPGQQEGPQSFSRLVLWVDAEVRRYATLVGRQLSATRRDLLENHPNAGQRDTATSAGQDDYETASPLMLTEANQRQAGMMAPLPPTSPRASPIVSPQAFLSQTRSHQLMKMATMSPTSASRRRSGGLLGGASASVVYDECFLTIGACLEVCFSLAGKLDRLGLPVKPTLARVLSTDLEDLLGGYARSICARLEREVGEEASTATTVPSLDLVLQQASEFVTRAAEEGAEDEGPHHSPAHPASRRHHAHHKAAPDLPKGQASVLKSAATLVSELNSLVANFIVLKAPPGAHVDYSADLCPLDPLLVREVCHVLATYPQLLDKRWGPLRQKKRTTASDSSELERVGASLQALAEVTLVSLYDRWLEDPVLLVDADDMRDRVAEVRAKYSEAIITYGGTPPPPPPPKPAPPAPAKATTPTSAAGKQADKAPQSGHMARPSVAGERATTPTGLFKGLLGLDR